MSDAERRGRKQRRAAPSQHARRAAGEPPTYSLPEDTCRELLEQVLYRNLRQADVDPDGRDDRFIALCNKAAQGLSTRLGIGRQELLFTATSKRGKAILAVERKHRRLAGALAAWRKQVESFTEATANSAAFAGDRINLKRNLMRLMREAAVTEQLTKQLTDRMPGRGNPGNPIGEEFVRDCERALLCFGINTAPENDAWKEDGAATTAPLGRLMKLILEAVAPDVQLRIDQRALARRPPEVKKILSGEQPIDEYEQTISPILVPPEGG